MNNCVSLREVLSCFRFFFVLLPAISFPGGFYSFRNCLCGFIIMRMPGYGCVVGLLSLSPESDLEETS